MRLPARYPLRRLGSSPGIGNADSAEERGEDRVLSICVNPRNLRFSLAFCVLLTPCGCEGPRADWATLRNRMVEEQLVARDIQDQKVLAVLRRVPRHEFVLEKLRASAYSDQPLPIGHEQTISQPYIVAFMTEAVKPQKEHRVLEIGTGSGYQAAVLAELVKEVYTIELVKPLAEEATERLKRLDYKNVQVRAGDGYKGWPDKAPFDSIVVTCGADHVPAPLFEQLKPGGILIIPVGDDLSNQWLRVITKGPKGDKQEKKVMPVRFVPLKRAPDERGK